MTERTEEKQPNRKLFVLNPDTFSGAIHSNVHFTSPAKCHDHISTSAHQVADDKFKSNHDVVWQLSDKVNIINDTVFKADNTFLYDDNHVQLNELKEDGTSLNIVIGPYYHAESKFFDVLAKMYQVTAVLNIQTKEEMQLRGQSNDFALIQQHINLYIHHEVSDTHQAEYETHLLKACSILKQLNDEGHKVYIMATAGFSRAQTLSLLYLSLEKESKKWYDFEHLWSLLSFQ